MNVVDSPPGMTRPSRPSSCSGLRTSTASAPRPRSICSVLAEVSLQGENADPKRLHAVNRIGVRAELAGGGVQTALSLTRPTGLWTETTSFVPGATHSEWNVASEPREDRGAVGAPHDRQARARGHGGAAGGRAREAGHALGNDERRLGARRGDPDGRRPRCLGRRHGSAPDADLCAFMPSGAIATSEAATEPAASTRTGMPSCPHSPPRSGPPVCPSPCASSVPL